MPFIGIGVAIGIGIDSGETSPSIFSMPMPMPIPTPKMSSLQKYDGNEKPVDQMKYLSIILISALLICTQVFAAEDAQVIKGGVLMGHHFARLTKYGDGKSVLQPPANDQIREQVGMWRVGDGILIIEYSLSACICRNISYVFVQADGKRITLPVKEFNPDIGEMVIAVPNQPKAGDKEKVVPGRATPDKPAVKDLIASQGQITRIDPKPLAEMLGKKMPKKWVAGGNEVFSKCDEGLSLYIVAADNRPEQAVILNSVSVCQHPPLAIVWAANGWTVVSNSNAWNLDRKTMEDLTGVLMRVAPNPQTWKISMVSLGNLAFGNEWRTHGNDLVRLASFLGVEFQFESDKQEYSVGDPIIITVHAVNTSDHDVVLRPRASYPSLFDFGVLDNSNPLPWTACMAMNFRDDQCVKIPAKSRVLWSKEEIVAATRDIRNGGASAFSTKRKHVLSFGTGNTVEITVK